MEYPISMTYKPTGSNSVDVPGETGFFSRFTSSISNIKEGVNKSVGVDSMVKRLTGFTSGIGESVGSFAGTTLSATIKPLFVFILIALVVYVITTALSRKVIGT